MLAVYLHRFFYRPRPTVNRFGEPVPPRPCLNSAVVRRSPSGDHLEVCMKGTALVGCGNGPQVTVDGVVAPCICFESETLVATLPPNVPRRVHIAVSYGTLVAGEFSIRTKPGRRVNRWAIRIDPRIRT